MAKSLCLLSAAGLAASIASGQAVTVDGSLDAAYGSPIWVNTNPTQFGDATNPGPSGCDPFAIGDPGAVETGFELAIPFSEHGLTGSETIRLQVMITNANMETISNQALPGYGTAFTPSITSETDFSNDIAFPGDQFVTIDLSSLTNTTPALDGSINSDGYTQLAVQNVGTNFGDNDNADIQASSGSELNGLYIAKDTDTLYLTVTGNFDSGFGGRLIVWLDTETGGQNPILFENPGAAAGAFPGTVGTDGTPRSAPGLTFDTGFEPDAMYALIAGGGNETTGLGAFFVDRVFLETGGDANSAGSGYLGDGTSLAVVPTHDGSLGTVGVGVTSGLLVQLDNTNIAGVPAACPNDDPSQIAFGGSEINAVYGFIEQTGNAPGPFGTGVNFLNLFVAGNLETADAGPDSNGGNKLNVFFDVNANEGQNRLGFNPTGAPAGDLSGISFGGLQNQEGVIFPNGFTADYWVAAKSQGQNLGVIFNINDVSPIYTEGSIDFPGNNSLFSFAAFDRIPMPAPVTFDGGPAFDEISEANGNLVNFAPRTVAKTENNNPDPESIIEGLTIISPPPPFTPLENRLDPIPGLIEYAIDNSNDGGITNTSGTGGETVTTGFEWRIDLAELGWDGTSPVRVFGYITGADFNFVSNQVIGGLPSAFDTINLSTASDAAGTVVNPADPDDQDTAGPLSADLDFSNTAIFPGVTDLVIPIGSTGTPCPPDQNEDNVLDIDDFSAFVQNFFAGDTLADVNDDGSLDIDDFSDFVAFFFNSGQFPGCPS